jgi:hypothetical protein
MANTKTVKEEEIVTEEAVRIPSTLEDNKLLVEFCKMYLAVVDEIAAYNKEVLQDRTDGWTNAKVLEKAKELGNPTDANVKPHEDIKAYLEKYEDVLSQLNFARKELLESTADVLGIVLTATNERDESVEKPLKEKRGNATQIATQLNNIANMTADPTTKKAVTEFLDSNPLPMVGRDQVRNFTQDTTSTPRYRVTVNVFKGDENVGTAQGFTKAGLMLTKSEYGYARGKALTGEDLRKAWENAGNSAANPYAVPTVEFTDNREDGGNPELRFVLTKS